MQVKKHFEREKERKREFINPISSIRNLLGGERHIPIKTIKSSDLKSSDIVYSI